MTDDTFETMVRLEPEARDRLLELVMARQKRGLGRKQTGSQQAVISDAIMQFEEPKIKIKKREG